MAVRSPKLEEGRVYHREEVVEYIGDQSGTSDFDVMKSHFPRSLDCWEADPRAWRDGEEILLQYRVFPMEDFKEQMRSLEKTYMQHDSERQRVDAIVETLQSGKPLFPVLMQRDDPQRRISEGYHRAVALWWLESACLPAFLAGYRNWFTEDELAPEFEG